MHGDVDAGIQQLPLRTPTLPPAAHTNAYIVGHERLVVVDPAPYDEDERDVLLQHLKSRVRRGAVAEAIVLTHHHADHMGAAEWLSGALQIPVWAHARTAELLSGRVTVDRFLDEDDVLELGLDAGGRRFDLRVLFTPGHASGHVVLLDERPGARALICGDMVAAIGSIVIDPPDGDMARYIAELRRLSALDPHLVFPAHGPPIIEGRAHLDGYVAHRLKREAKVQSALQDAGSGRPEDLLPSAYDDTPVFLYPLAARACLAHLEKLVHDGVATRDGERFTFKASP